MFPGKWYDEVAVGVRSEGAHASAAAARASASRCGIQKARSYRGQAWHPKGMAPPVISKQRRGSVSHANRRASSTGATRKLGSKRTASKAQKMSSATRCRYSDHRTLLKTLRCLSHRRQNWWNRTCLGLLATKFRQYSSGSMSRCFEPSTRRKA